MTEHRSGSSVDPAVDYDSAQRRIRRQREALEWLETLDEDQLAVVRDALLDETIGKKPCPLCGLMLSTTRKPVIHLEQAKVHQGLTEAERQAVLDEW